MPFTVYTEEEVQHYTRLLARCYDILRDDASPHPTRPSVLKDIRSALGWSSGYEPPFVAHPENAN